MSKAVSTAISNAINKINGIKSVGRITVFKNKNYFSGFTETSGSPSFSQSAGITDFPVPQDAVYDNANAMLYSLFVDPTSQVIKVSTCGSPIISTLYSSGSPISSVKYNKFSVRLPYLYHVDIQGSLKVETIDEDSLLSDFTSGSPACITATETIEALTSGSPCSITAVDDLEFVRMFVDDGGIGISHYKYEDSDWSINTYAHRFMFPEFVVTTGSDPGYDLNYSTAVKRSDGIWAYLSYPSGEVKGIHLNNDGYWSDIFVAIPKDLCVFKISNSFVDVEENIHLIGQFQRVDDENAFSSDSVWNLRSKSVDGKVFSLDPFTLFSLMGNRFHAVPVGNEIYYVDLGKYAKASADYNSIYEDAESLELRKEITSISGGPDTGYTASLVTANDALIDSELLVEGNVAKFEIGINTSGSGIEFSTYDTCILSRVDTVLGDAIRGLTLEFLSDGIYRLQQFSYPFYLEIQGKQCVYDPVSDFSNLYEAPNSSGIREKFCTDFWGNEDLYSGGGLSAMSHTASQDVTLMSTDLKEYLALTDYPVIESLPLTVKIYGWSRIGIPGSAPDPWTDSTPASNDNDTFAPVFKVVHEDDDDEVTISLTPSDADTVAYPPQQWKEGNARANTGIYPVLYTLDESSGLQVGDTIKEVGVLIQSTSPTVFYIERVEIPELSMYVDPSLLGSDEDDISDLTGYDPVQGVNDWDFDDGTTQGFTNGNDLISYTHVCVTGAVGSGTTNTFYASGGGIGWTAGNNWYYGNAYYDLVSRNIIMKEGISFTGTYYGVYSAAGFKINAAIEFTDGTVVWAFGDKYSGDTGWLSAGDSGTFTVTPNASFYGKTIRRLWLGTFGYRYDHAGNKIFDNLHLIGVETTDESEFSDTAEKSGIAIKNLGVPNIYFSSKPYSAFNFEASVKVKVVGSSAYGGIVGIAEDARNYICGRYKPGTLEIIKVRGDRITVLATTSYTGTDTFTRIMFAHKDGDLSIRVLEGGVWGDPKLTYRWKYEDGPMATDIDLFHVGIYAMSDVAKFRICSFDPNISSSVGMLPGFDVDKFDEFPSSGTVVIDNMVYTYSGKTAMAITPRGPFQLRNVGAWNYSSPADGEGYSGNSVEFTMFEWIYNPTYHAKYANYLIASNAGYGWINNEIDFKPWITTGGVLLYLTNRCRAFCQNLDTALGVSCMDKIFITYALTGISLAPDQETYLHSEGTYCYEYQETEIEFTDFYASSDDQDSSIQDLISKICKMAGASSVFLGDNVIESLELTDGEEETL